MVSLLSSGPCRVLHCPALVGGYPTLLAEKERELGLQSRVVALTENPLGYKVEEMTTLEKVGLARFEAKRWQLLYQAIHDFDVIHFNFGRTIMPVWIPFESHQNYSKLLRFLYQIYTRMLELKDLPLLKKMGKGIVVTFQGGDARQCDFCLKHFEISTMLQASEYYPKSSDERKRWKIRMFSRYADKIYSLNPDLLHVLPSRAEFLPYPTVDLAKWRPIGQTNNPAPVVLHAPSNRKEKGTAFVLDAVRRLKAEDISFEFLLVEGMKHENACREYAKADLLIDQLLCGWYGGLALEFMALGKPVVCYLRKEDLKFIPLQMQRELPIIEASPETIYEVLKTWLTHRRTELIEQGMRSRVYAEKWHDPSKIAARTKLDYEAIWKGAIS